MPPPILDIADALVEKLNERPFSQAVEAVRHYRPRFDLADFAVLRASVVPTAFAAHERTSRAGALQDTYAFQLAFYKRVQLDGESPTLVKNPDMDGLAALVAEVADYFLRTPRPLQPRHPAHCVAAAVDPVFSAEQQDQGGLFASVVTLTFRHWS